MKYLQKFFIALCVFGSGTLNIMAQEIVASAGDFVETESAMLSWTIGEPVIETFSSGDNILTQGIQQSEIIVTEIGEVPSLEFKISAFPNPANEFVRLSVEGENIGNLNLLIYDINAKVFLQKQLESYETTISMDSYVPGVYFLKLYSGNKVQKVFRIQKK